MFYILKDGVPVLELDTFKYAEWMDSNRVLARDILIVNEEEIIVSTVFLGIDHGFGRGELILWETMILVELMINISADILAKRKHWLSTNH